MSGNIRFRPAACASYASPTLDSTNLPPKKIAESSRSCLEKRDYRNVGPHVSSSPFFRQNALLFVSVERNNGVRMTVEIYVNLLEEGTPCSRLTQAQVLENGLLRLLPTDNYDPDDEHWEFPPGSIVRGREVRRDGKSTLLAVAPKSDMPG